MSDSKPTVVIAEEPSPQVNGQVVIKSVNRPKGAPEHLDAEEAEKWAIDQWNRRAANSVSGLRFGK